MEKAYINHQVIQHLPKRKRLKRCKTCSTPAVTGKKLTKSECNQFYDPTLYKSLTTVLHYGTIIRPEISFVENRLSQFWQWPIDLHWKLAKKGLRYIEGTIYMAYVSTSRRLYVMGFSNVDWAYDNEDRNSVSGNCVLNQVSRSSHRDLAHKFNNIKRKQSWQPEVLISPRQIEVFFLPINQKATQNNQIIIFSSLSSIPVHYLFFQYF